MKIIITESQFRSITEDQFKRSESLSGKVKTLLNKRSSEYDWCGGIDVDVSSTIKGAGWKKNDTPLLLYLIKFNGYDEVPYDQQKSLKDEISFIHSMFFPVENETVTCYLATHSVFPNGEIETFPCYRFPVAPLVESNERTKRFLKNKLNIDFGNSIKQITSSYDVPMEFDECLYGSSINRYLNIWGPMYLFKLDGVKYLYQDRGEFEWFMSDDCWDYVDNEIPEKLGIDEMGFKFSDILDMYFEED
jgi:hypothetical protein